jgi:hypothetical protein
VSAADAGAPGTFDTGSRSPLEPEALALTMPLGEAMFTQRSIRKMRPDPTAETTHWNEWGGSAPWA